MPLPIPSTFYEDTRKYCEFLSSCELAKKSLEMNAPIPPKNTLGTELTDRYFTIYIDKMSLQELEGYKKVCLPNEQNFITEHVDNQIDTFKTIQAEKIAASMMQLVEESTLQGQINTAKKSILMAERNIASFSGRSMFNAMRARGITYWEGKLKDAKQQLYTLQEQTPEGKIKNATEDLERLKKDLGNLQKQNGYLERNCFTKIWNNKEIESNHKEIRINRLKIDSLEYKIYGPTEIYARETQEIAHQKNWNNALGKIANAEAVKNQNKKQVISK